MNREIKFRVWDQITKNMFNEISLKDSRICGFYDQGYICMQYTGLKDKNGKEIYEGDILQYKRYYASRRWWSNSSEIEQIEKDFEKQKADFYIEKSQIRFENGQFKLNYPINAPDIGGMYFDRGKGINGDYEEKIWDFEVIGNIYENPELLK